MQGSEIKEKRNQDIEVLRAAAILFTLMAHAHALFPWWGDTHLAQLGGYFAFWSGVDLFLVISGFVIARDLVRKLQSSGTGEKFWRVASVALNRLGLFGNSRIVFRDTISALTQVANLHCWQCATYHTACDTVDTPYWSLSLEEQFYLCIPLLFFLMRKNFVRALGALVLAQFFLPRPQVSFLWYVRSDALMLGVLLAIFSRSAVYSAVKPSLLSNRWIGAPLVLLLLVCLAAVPGDGGIVPFSTGLVALVSAVLVFFASYDEGYIMKPGLLKRLAVWVGSRPYALYLIHLPIIFFTRELWYRLSPPGTFFGASYSLRYALVAYPLLFLITDLNTRFLENPLRKYGRRIAEKLEQQVLAATEPRLAPFEEEEPVSADLSIEH